MSKWPEFSNDPSEQSGYFFPSKLDDRYAGKDVTVTGTKTKTAQDLEWVLKVKDKNSKFTFSTAEDGEFLKLTFNGAAMEPPIGKDAVKPFDAKTDFGGYGKSSDYIDGSLSVTWDGITGKVSGKLKYYDGNTAGNSKNKNSGHFLPVVLGDWYSDKSVSVFCKNERPPQQETDWIMTISDDKTPVTVKYNGAVVAKLDLTGVTLGEMGG